MQREIKLLTGLAGILAALLVYHACGSSAPFRDAGEFAVAAPHLNIAHPPGYPFYTLLSKFWVTVLPWGNAAYRLNVLSALACAGSFWLVAFWLMRAFQVSFLAAVIASGSLVTTRFVLGLSFVSEMYTVGLLWLAGLLFLIHRSKENPQALLAAGFLFPLALGTRMDLAFAAFYALPFFPLWLQSGRRKYFLSALGFFALGCSVFLYLKIRSAAWPLVNWGDPSTFLGVFNSMIRKSYGSTVDLLSQSYRSGELFTADALHWLKVVWETFGPLVFFIPVGVYLLGLRGSLGPSLLCWLVTGPFFLYLSNLPPNPHAVKIMEDHFIPSLLMMSLWLAVGLDWIVREKILRWFDSPGRHGARLSLIILLSIFIWRISNWGLRNNFYAYDYAGNVFRSAPPGSIVVLHEDVQLFSAWEAHLNRKRRPDLRLIAQGLSGSPWYQKCVKERWGYRDVALPAKLIEPQAWELFLAANPSAPIYSGFETDVPGDGLLRSTQGLLQRLCRRNDASCAAQKSLDLWPFLIRRGTYRQDQERFFFNQDLIEDYSRASFTLANDFLSRSKTDQGFAFFKRTLLLRPLFAQAAIALAYNAAFRSDWPRALFWWERSLSKVERLLELTREYHSLPDVVAPIKNDLSYVLTSLGVTKERLGENLNEVAGLHQKAIEHNPSSVIAHYNLAATYWKLREPEKARGSFAAVLRLDPNHTEAKKFLSILATQGYK